MKQLDYGGQVYKWECCKGCKTLPYFLSFWKDVLLISRSLVNWRWGYGVVDVSIDWSIPKGEEVAESICRMRERWVDLLPFPCVVGLDYTHLYHDNSSKNLGDGFLSELLQWTLLIRRVWFEECCMLQLLVAPSVHRSMVRWRRGNSVF